MRIAMIVLLACAGAFSMPSDARAADAERGRELYVQRCGACHGRSVHSREARVAKSMVEVRGWVKRWSDTLGLGWGADEVEDVSLYLNDTYYRFAMPARSASGNVKPPRHRES